MMSEERFVLTRPGYEKLQNELHVLEQLQAREIEEAADAFDGTDFGENAAFYDAVFDRDRLADRVNHLKMVLARAEIIEEDLDPQRVTPGDRVTVWDFEERAEVIFNILSSEEVAYGHKGISTESPVGRALLGHMIGDTVEVETPSGRVNYTIRKIEAMEGL